MRPQVPQSLSCGNAGQTHLRPTNLPGEFLDDQYILSAEHDLVAETQVGVPGLVGKVPDEITSPDSLDLDPHILSILRESGDREPQLHQLADSPK